jgi:hypothetical protein
MCAEAVYKTNINKSPCIYMRYHAPCLPAASEFKIINNDELIIEIICIKNLIAKSVHCIYYDWLCDNLMFLQGM